jgi:hypothetical protein
MAFAEPQSVTINSVANSLPRVSVGDMKAIYQKDDASVKLTVQHSPGKVSTRRVIRLDTSKIAADPLLPDVNRVVPFGVYLVAITPNVGMSLADQKDQIKGFLGNLSATSDANLIKWLGGES